MSIKITNNISQSVALTNAIKAQLANDKFFTKGDSEGAKAQESTIAMPSRSLYNSEVLNHQFYNPLLFSLTPGADKDVDRYKDIMKGRARRELLKFKDPNKFIGKKGDKLISVPIPGIQLPRFIRGTNKQGPGGIGQGDGDPGDPIGQGEDSSGTVGDQPGGHIREELIPMSRAEIARILKEGLGLPNLLPKGEENLKKEGIKWNTFCRVGTELDLRESLKNAMIRTAKERGVSFDLKDVIIEEQDKIFRSWKILEKPECNLAIIYMMDVSGSMTDEQKEEVRKISWYLSTIIQLQFGEARAKLRNEIFSDSDFGEGVREIFIIHDASAREVPEDEYYSTRESGGTKISSAYNLAEAITNNRYPFKTWNVYMFHFSDGDNWGDDTPTCLEIVGRLKPDVNLFGYVQVESPYGSGEWGTTMMEEYGSEDRTIRIANLGVDADSDAYEKALKIMLGERK